MAASVASLTTVAEAARATCRAAEDRPKKSVMFTMLPQHLGLEERFRLAKAVGFEGVEIPPQEDEAAAAAMRGAAEKAGIPIQSVIYGGWDNPLTSADPAVVTRGQ